MSASFATLKCSWKSVELLHSRDINRTEKLMNATDATELNNDAKAILVV